MSPTAAVSACTVPGCGRPTGEPDATVCGACLTRWAGALLGAPDPHVFGLAVLARDLETALARQQRIGEQAPTRARRVEQPLAFGWAAGDALWSLVQVVTTCVTRLIADGSVRASRTRLPGRLDECAGWLLAARDVVRYHPAGGDLVDELLDAIGRAWAVVDRPAVRAYVGPCRCGHDLYARHGADTVRCGECGASYATDARQRWLVTLASDRLAPSAEIARALPGLVGRAVKPATLRSWVHRGRLVDRGCDRAGRRLYRIGDVIELLGPSK